jgi:fused signal recognition particle receptor
VIENLRQAVKEKGLKGDQIHAELRAQLSAILAPCQGEWVPGQGTQVIMMVGVNGAGKTTTLGKLAAKHKAAGRSVMLAAGDTFRAAAVEQLKTWGERAQVPVVAQDTGADSASVIFDALSSARAKQTDILLADTAGRLQNKDHLMDELSKVVRVLKKQDEQAPHEVLLVLDAGTGQNALSQAELFTQAVGVTGLVLTKLDGTAKGGVAFAIADKMGLPIRYIGVGEGIADLQPFDADAFVAALFDDA